jgi:threonine/homoserine/homoserine lactone efflux protein
LPFSFTEIYTYAGIVALLVMFPGPNTVLVMQSTGARGRRAGFFNVAGIVTAVYLNAMISGLGLSLIVLRSAEVYAALKLLGACFIAFLGVNGLLDAWRLHKQRLEAVPTDNTVSERDAVFEPINGMAFYSKGLLTGILNPKSALFFMAFFPLFMHRDGNIAVQWITLTVVYSVVSVVWYGSLVLFIGKLRRFLARRNTQKWLKAVTGTILLEMGIKIAAQR